MVDHLASVWDAYAEIAEHRTPRTPLPEGEQLLARVIDQVPVAVGLVNRDREWVLCNRQMRRFVPRTVATRDPATLVSWRSFNDDGTLVPPEQWPLDRALRGETVLGMEFLFTAPDGKEIWTRVSAGPLLVKEGGATEYIMAVVEDIDELKRAEQKVKLIGRELEHRTNNILARVEAVINLTKADTVPEFFRALQNRIGALARTDKLLSKAGQGVIQFKCLLEQELAPYKFRHDGSVRLEGPDFALTPQGAEAFGLVFHELATNAAKYGALSHVEGHLTVQWSRAPGDRVRIQWSEAGTRPVMPPLHSGFGTRVIDTILRRQLGGRADFQWKADGLFCEFEVPMERLGASFEQA